ncbi:transcription factor 25-like isoform X2 [Dreissena polymorpha]|uniref:transcription factor 25-like isoform X2 n=1 Tax=Dreissena polymorpha TaxID=45954 RepID=UPI002264D8AF|nr:transcription factor 25-like isoform X2 [Dreissena polymorpha]
MSMRTLRKLHGDDRENLNVPEIESDDDEAAGYVAKSRISKTKKKAKVENLYDLLDADDKADEEVEPTDDKTSQQTAEKDETPVENTGSKKKRKKKKKKNKDQHVTETAQIEEEDEIDASIREVNRLLDNHNIGERNVASDAHSLPSSGNKPLLHVEHRNLNPDTELKRIFGSRVIREEGMRRRHQGRRRQKLCWLTTPKDSWAPIGKTGLSMRLLEQKAGCQYFLFEHSQSYQKVQFQFCDAVESMNPQNILDVIQLAPYHIDGLIQLSEIFRMNEDMNMATEIIERSMYAMEMSFHPMFNLATGTCRLEYRYRENRCLFLAMFKHIASLGNRGCNRTALEFCKLMLSLDPDADPLCALLMIDFYAIRATDYEFLIRLYNEWEAHRNLSQLPNFAFSLPLAYFLQAEGDATLREKADEKLQESLLMFPGMLAPLLDKCGVQADASATHAFFKQAEYDDPVALKQLIALYAGRCHVCWKVPNVMEWLERNVKEVLARVAQKDPLVETYKTKRLSRYKGTPRNIYRHILVSEIRSATATLPQDVASTVLSYDPLPPLDSVEAYKRPSRPSRAQTESSAFSMFLRSLMPNFNPNEAVPDGAVGGEGQPLRQGVGALMDAMRDLMNNIRVGNPEEGGQGAGAEAGQGPNGDEEHLEEWD